MRFVTSSLLLVTALTWSPPLSAASGETLHKAAKKGDLAKLSKLYAKGADVDAKDKNGDTALLVAIRKRHFEVARFLVTHGADVNRGDRERPISLASEMGALETVELLIQQGADIDSHSRDGHTALEAASENGHKEVVALLLDKGADPTRAGSTALEAASRNGHKEVVALLLDKGADPHRLLFYSGADPNRPFLVTEGIRHYSMLAWQVALSNHHDDTACLLLSRGGNPMKKVKEYAVLFWRDGVLPGRIDSGGVELMSIEPLYDAVNAVKRNETPYLSERGRWSVDIAFYRGFIELPSEQPTRVAGILVQGGEFAFGERIDFTPKGGEILLLHYAIEGAKKRAWVEPWTCDALVPRASGGAAPLETRNDTPSKAPPLPTPTPTPAAPGAAEGGRPVNSTPALQSSAWQGTAEWPGLRFGITFTRVANKVTELQVKVECMEGTGAIRAPMSGITTIAGDNTFTFTAGQGSSGTGRFVSGETAEGTYKAPLSLKCGDSWRAASGNWRASPAKKLGPLETTEPQVPRAQEPAPPAGPAERGGAQLRDQPQGSLRPMAYKGKIAFAYAPFGSLASGRYASGSREDARKLGYRDTDSVPVIRVDSTTLVTQARVLKPTGYARPVAAEVSALNVLIDPTGRLYLLAVCGVGALPEEIRSRAARVGYGAGSTVGFKYFLPQKGTLGENGEVEFIEPAPPDQQRAFEETLALLAADWKAGSATEMQGTLGANSVAGDRAVDYYKNGLDTAKTGDYKEAIAQFEKAIGRDPAFAKAYTARALAYIVAQSKGMSTTDSNVVEKMCAEACNHGEEGCATVTIATMPKDNPLFKAAAEKLKEYKKYGLLP